MESTNKRVCEYNTGGLPHKIDRISYKNWGQELRTECRFYI